MRYFLLLFFPLNTLSYCDGLLVVLQKTSMPVNVDMRPNQEESPNQEEDFGLRAKWRSVRWNDSNQTKVDVAKFIGFVHGRLGVPPPDWWEKMLLTARPNNRRNPYFSEGDYWPLYRVEGTRTMIPIGSTIEDNDKGILVQTEDHQRFIIEASVWEKAEQKFATANIPCFLINDEHVFFVLAYSSPTPSYLFKAERDSGEIIWQAVIKADDRDFLMRGPDYNYAEIVVQEDDSLIVFGIGTGCAYIEGIDKDGEKTFEFNTILN